jgi:hypothetical protein
LYWENGARGSVIVAAAQKTSEISLPVAITVFPVEDFRRDSDLFADGVRNLATQERIQAAFKRGLQTRDAE